MVASIILLIVWHIGNMMRCVLSCHIGKSNALRQSLEYASNLLKRIRPIVRYRGHLKKARWYVDRVIGAEVLRYTLITRTILNR